MGMKWSNPGFGFCMFCAYVLTINIRINLQKQHKSSLLKSNAHKLKIDHEEDKLEFK